LNLAKCVLMDMNGEAVHSWDVGYAYAPRITKQGHLVVNRKRQLKKYDWDAKLIWELTVPDRIFPGTLHHAIEIADNGDIAFIVSEHVPKKYTRKIKEAKRKNIDIVGDVLLIANKDGELIWEWHLCEYFDVASVYDDRDFAYDWAHTNTVQIIPENHWYSVLGHEEFKPGNVLFCARNFNKIFIIDRQTKKIVWEYQGDFNGGLAHPHGPLMIEQGMPGEGNILIFDNGLFPSNRGQFLGPDRQSHSFVLEINPYRKEVMWSYPDKIRSLGKPRASQFFSVVIGYCQRLANGNTLIFETEGYRIFEVTQQARLVWEWVGYSRGFLKIYSYNHCPQLAALGKPQERAVTPPTNEYWHLKPVESK